MAGDGIEKLEQELEKTRRDFERLKDKYQRRGTGKSKQRNHVLILMGTWIEGQLLGRGNPEEGLFQFLQRHGKIETVVRVLRERKMQTGQRTIFVNKGDLDKLRKLGETELEKLNKTKTSIDSYFESRRELILEWKAQGLPKKKICELLTIDCGFPISVKRLNTFLGESKKPKEKAREKPREEKGVTEQVVKANKVTFSSLG